MVESLLVLGGLIVMGVLAAAISWILYGPR